MEPHYLAAVIAGEEAALALQTAAGDDVLVPVARQQADILRRVVRRHFGGSSRTDLRSDPSLERQPCPVRAANRRVMTSSCAKKLCDRPRGSNSSVAMARS